LNSLNPIYMKVKYFLFLVFLFAGIKSYSQCTVNIAKTDVSCFGRNNGTATASISGGVTSNNCAIPPGSPYSCSSGCTSTVNDNSSDITITTGQVCLTTVGFTKGITLNGGTLVICGTATPSSFTFKSGMLIINGTATFNSKLIMKDNSCTLTNYGTLTLNNGLNVNGNFNNHGTCNLSGNFNDPNSGGTITNTNILKVLNGGNFNNHHNFTNSGNFTVSGAWANNNQSSTTNNCTITASSFSSAGPMSNNGKINITNGFTLTGNTITTQARSELVCSSLQINNGALIGTGSSCSSVLVNGNATIGASAAISGNISICVSGTTTNHAGPIAQLNCNCNVNAAACTYSWKNSANQQVSSSITASGLGVGTYTFTATCSTCPSPVTGTVTINGPPAISVSTTKTDVNCTGGGGGSITVTASGGTGAFLYSKDFGSKFQSSNVFNGLSAGNYFIMVKDASNCISAVQSVTILETSPITVTAAKTDVSCHGGNDGSITVTAEGTGSGALEYSKDNGATFQSGNVFSSLTAGTYNIVVKHNNGCRSAIAVVISQPGPTTLTFNHTDATGIGASDGTATVIINNPGSGGTCSYSWSNGATTANVTGLTAGTYSVTVVCPACSTVTGSVEIKEPFLPSFAVMKKRLDGGYYQTANKTLYFKFEEEYSVPAGTKLNYRIYNKQRVGVQLQQDNVVYGDNRYSINVSSLTANDYYTLEVENSKNEKWLLRFKVNE
jgi:hypothetical protein